MWLSLNKEKRIQISVKKRHWDCISRWSHVTL
jgi:ribosomal protein L39E